GCVASFDTLKNRVGFSSDPTLEEPRMAGGSVALYDTCSPRAKHALRMGLGTHWTVHPDPAEAIAATAARGPFVFRCLSFHAAAVLFGSSRESVARLKDACAGYLKSMETAYLYQLSFSRSRCWRRGETVIEFLGRCAES